MGWGLQGFLSLVFSPSSVHQLQSQGMCLWEQLCLCHCVFFL